MRIFIFLFLIISILLSCKKDLSELPFQKINVPVQSTLRDVVFLNDNELIVCGGDNNSGILLKSTDNGTSWHNITGTFEFPVNCLYFINADTGFAADSEVIIQRTVDGGNTWTPFYDTSWPLTVNRNLRSIWFTNDSTGFVCGGKNLGNGVMYQTTNMGTTWTYSEYQHEYRDICFTDELNGIMCGYGSLMITEDGGQNFYATDFNKHYFTGLALDQYNNYWMCDFNGKVFTSSNKGRNWSAKREGSAWNVKANQLNSIAISPSGRIACAGPNGFITWSNDSGNTWNNRTSFESNDILKIKWISDDELVAVGKKGGLFRIKM